MRIIEQDNNYIYILADQSKVVMNNSSWGIGMLIKKEELDNVKEVPDSDIFQFLAERDKQLY